MNVQHLVEFLSFFENDATFFKKWFDSFTEPDKINFLKIMYFERYTEKEINKLENLFNHDVCGCKKILFDLKKFGKCNVKIENEISNPEIYEIPDEFLTQSERVNENLLEFDSKSLNDNLPITSNDFKKMSSDQVVALIKFPQIVKVLKKIIPNRKDRKFLIDGVGVMLNEIENGMGKLTWTEYDVRKCPLEIEISDTTPLENFSTSPFLKNAWKFLIIKKNESINLYTQSGLKTLRFEVITKQFKQVKENFSAEILILGEISDYLLTPEIYLTEEKHLNLKIIISDLWVQRGEKFRDRKIQIERFILNYKNFLNLHNLNNYNDGYVYKNNESIFNSVIFIKKNRKKIKIHNFTLKFSGYEEIGIETSKKNFAIGCLTKNDSTGALFSWSKKLHKPVLLQIINKFVKPPKKTGCFTFNGKKYFYFVFEASFIGENGLFKIEDLRWRPDLDFTHISSI